MKKAWLTINRECNLRCSWCYAQTAEHTSKQDMSPAHANRIINLLHGLKASIVMLVGGEPTLHPNLLEIISALEARGLKSSIITNGLKFSDKNYLSMAVKAGLDMINVSCKAFNQQSYKSLTGVDGFHHTLQAVENICELSINHIVSLTISDHDFSGLHELIKQFKQMRVAKIHVELERPYFLNGSIQSPNEPMNVQARTLEELSSILDQCKIDYKLNIRIPFCSFKKGFIEKLIARDRIVSGCQLVAGSGIIVDSNGNLLPCNQMHDYPLGQVGVDFTTASEYMSYVKTGSVADFFNAMKSCPDEKCVDCRYWSYCGGGCRMLWFDPFSKR